MAKKTEEPILGTRRASVDKWETKLIEREKIKNAPYNPRFMTDQARDKLRENLMTRGLMGGLVWNKRTGNLVSGHQRIKAIDMCEKTGDYMITVTVVDLTLKEEKAQNIFMNNSLAQGEFEEEKLLEILKELDGDAMTGFSESDIIRFFGEPIIKQDIDSLEEEAAKQSELAGFFAGLQHTSISEMDNFYCVLVFKNASEKDAVITSLGLDVNKFYAATEFVSACEARRSVVKEEEAKPKGAKRGEGKAKNNTKNNTAS